MAYIKFENLEIRGIIDEVKVETSRNYNTSQYHGGTGSNTSYIGENSRVLTFKSICRSEEVDENTNSSRIKAYTNLSQNYKAKTGVLTSSSQLNLKGNYIITGFDVTENTHNSFVINWKFTEVKKFNRTKKTFRVWGKAPTSSKKKTQSKSKTTPTKNTKYLLLKCGNLKKGSTKKKCVKSLQTFLNAGGLYREKIDGDYGNYTVKAVKKAQKKNGLKTTGEWDKTTRKYYQKLYNYPTKKIIEKSKANAKKATKKTSKKK